MAVSLWFKHIRTSMQYATHIVIVKRALERSHHKTGMQQAETAATFAKVTAAAKHLLTEMC